MLSDLIAPARRLALVGLAKNTGKTQTLAAILTELARRGGEWASPRSVATARRTT